ncbi:hypothetical protein IE53DRAFT_334778, partial [Violaceomyces palustris]
MSAATRPRHLGSSQSGHSPVTSADMELLDMLTSMPSSFPHQPPSLQGSAGHKRPLATLTALRRPPLDPIILAASLSSGPHVTRHHFHHSFRPGEHGKESKQMPASQRKKAAIQEHLGHEARHSRSSSVSGSYANCDLDTFPTSSSHLASSSKKADPPQVVEEPVIEPVPEVTEEEMALYASRQAPRSVRLERERKERERLEALKSSHQKSTASDSASPGPAPSGQTEAKMLVNHPAEREVSRATSVNEDDRPQRPANIQRQTSLALTKALDERKAAAQPSQPGQAPASAMVPSASQSMPVTPLGRPAVSSIVRPPPLVVRCHARTRIPTPHGEIFCHLYRNNYDAKEHLALVIDPRQNDEHSTLLDSDGNLVWAGEDPNAPPPLRSRTLDEVWGPEETDMERLVRGAYVGRLGPQFQVASRPSRQKEARRIDQPAEEDELAPLVRIHSECYTGETIGSQRCDCGEQLDEAIRLIHEAYGSHGGRSASARGVVVYLRQEGRGIGLLDKLMAYNLQDMGHDTVSANILLGHLPDARKYDIASAILRDLGVNECRLLTNNPEKMEALEAEGVRVRERVGMVPRAWKYGKSKKKTKRKSVRSKEARQSSLQKSIQSSFSSPQAPHKGKSRLAQLGSPGLGMGDSMISQAGTSADSDSEMDPTSLGLRHQGEDVLEADDLGTSSGSESDSSSGDSYVSHMLRRGGATMIGSSITRGPELEKYLRTKVERMGHLLDIPPEGSSK